MNLLQPRIAILILCTLLVLPPAASAAAATGIGQASPVGGMSPVSTTPLDPDCLPSDGGDPGANPCGQTAPASQDDNDKVEQGAGNPIDVITGNKYQRETDMPALPGILGIEIVRHYNSAQAGPDAPLGLLGRGWRLSYETDLHVIGQQLHIIQADGRRLVFFRDADDARRHVGSDSMRGVVTAEGLPGPHVRYRWRWPDGRTLDFDARGKLVQIKLPSGEFVSLTRGPQGELMKVTDPQGRSLSFEYAPRGAEGFRGVVAISSPLGRFTYAHQNTPSRPGLSNLAVATHPDGSARRYHYGADPGEAAPAWPHHLTGISLTEKPTGDTASAAPITRRLSTYAYDSKGRAVMSVRGAARQLDEAGKVVPGTGIGQVELDFSTPGSTLLTNSLGQHTRYRYTRLGGETRLLEAIGPGCASCSETNVRYGYDKRGRLIEVTRLDATGRALAATVIERDAMGRVVRESILPHAGRNPMPARLLVRYEYADDGARPVLVARPSVVRGREHQLRYSFNAAGQITRVTEHGFSSLGGSGVPAADPSEATPIERTTTFTYTMINGRSLLAAIDGPLANGPGASPADSDIAIFHWDPQGSQMIALTKPGGSRHTLDYHPLTGLLQRVSNDEGQATAFSYTPRQQVVTARSDMPGWAQPWAQHFRYDDLGRAVASSNATQPVENWLRVWDEHGRLMWHASALGILDHYAYDAEGRLLERSRRSASFVQTESRRYDEQGRLIAVRDNAGRGRQWHYDALGRLRYAVDADGLVHPAARTPSATSLAPESPTPPQTLRDDFGRTVWQRSPDSGTIVREYDEADRLAAMRDARGNRAHYTYDTWGRIQRQRITDARTGATEETVWRYAGRRLVEVRHPTQHERYEYDAHGLRSARIVTLPTADGALTTITRYEHDDAGQLVATTLPDGSHLRYERNGQGQVIALRRESAGAPWPGWLAREELIASEFERDLVGLRRYVTGNGIETRFQRSREGVLARVVHRHRPLPQHRVANRLKPWPLARTPAEAVEQLLGIGDARAQSTATVTPVADISAESSLANTGNLPGALGEPDDPAALLDHRYLWDVRGNLLHGRQRALGGNAQPTASGHAYDRDNRLLASVRWRMKDDTLVEQAVWRYAYDPSQRRILSQQNVASQRELQAGTQRSHFEPLTHRVLASPDSPSRYSTSGQPERLGQRDYEWDARGRLVEVREDSTVIARYGYDHRGLRNTKHAGGRTTHTLYDEHHQPLAELDAKGRILRQYIWLADLPVAVIDTPEGVAAAAADDSATARFFSDLQRLWRNAFGSNEGVAWLHGNHLGAPELATDADGQVLWRATYAPFGAATIESRTLTLNLRLPGQYFDPETGLHYNRARYYDPEQGQYLSPDPLGTPDGPNPYAYVAHNPLRFIDPDGLILFAFDGTDNSRDRRELERLGGSLTNVARFVRLYDDGPRRYVSGVGTHHFEDGNTNYLDDEYLDILPNGLGPIPDRGGNFTGRARIDRMWRYFIDEAEGHPDDETMDIDIMGFSRGAAQAREFASRLAAASIVHDGVRYLRYTAIDRASGQNVTRCQPVNLRFMGLFDTVLSTDLPWGAAYRLAIPAEFAHVAHAVALNEYRSQPYSSDVFGYPLNAAFWNATRRNLPDDLHQGGFPLESIGASRYTPGQVRIERGFIGAHADIGGGYEEGENQLSFVALNWMVEQAQKAGVNMRPPDADSSIPMANPIIHDQSNTLRIGDPRDTPTVSREVQQGDMTFIETERLRAEDREVRGAVGGTTQRDMGFTDFGPDDRSLTTGETHDFIAYTERPVTGNPSDTWNALTGNRTGLVDIAAYMGWLCQHGYFEQSSAPCASGVTP
ncbi:conserved exported protein of unknown function [Thauera humireducens]|uniref:RHS repeat-associated core domain-containing protein n=1 Tax=Thauera humireducens TaxID=1134435 RepID=UPI002467A297|nr:RHS repeat-associated core domain-containing protein [Thauera humireducens]CAH1747316.1 conserved exported protein of unknown function [Thauera humireducens]